MSSLVEFYNRPIMKELYEVKLRSKAWHLIGLVSDGNVHCPLDHIKAVIKGLMIMESSMCMSMLCLDGRDVVHNVHKAI